MEGKEAKRGKVEVRLTKKNLSLIKRTYLFIFVK